MKALKFIWNYLNDWKNWLSHSIIGVLIILVAFYLPVEPLYRVIILIAVVSFNVVRMKMEKKRKNRTID